MKRIIYTSACLFLAAFTATSCSDFLSEYSQDMIVAKSVNDLDEILLGDGYMSAIENSEGPKDVLPAGFFNILDDDINHSAGPQNGQTSKAWGTCTSKIFGYFAWQFRVGSNYNASYFSNDNVTWTDMYSRINVMNVILDEITDMPRESDEDAATFLRVQGEAHFLRAWSYFTLVNLYGDAYSPETCEQKLGVPLKLTPYIEHDKDKDTQFQRASVKEVYDQIVKDLLLAEDFLTRSPQKSAHRLHRASLEAVDLLLSRVYLYMQEWENAEKKAEAVIASPNFSLTPLSAWTDGFTFLTSENPEVILSQGGNTLNTTTVFTGQAGDFCVTQELRDLYMENDRRANCFFGVRDSIILANKYERSSAILPHISDAFTLRLSEAYLNQAEACSMQSGKETKALQALNALRKERITEYTNEQYTGGELVQQIRDERRKELCFEGHRWFDLRRYAVCKVYPYSKRIVHVFHVCDDFGAKYEQKFVLEENDPAYTFALPESVIKFDDVPMTDNPRKEREPIADDTDEEESEDIEENK